MVKKNKFSKSCNAIEVKYIGTFCVFLWAFSTRHYICIGSGCVIGSGVLLPPPSLPFKPYIISVDMAWWSQPQLELDDLKLTIWGNNVLYCWYCYEFSQLLRLIMATYVLHSFDLVHWLTWGSFMCTAKRKFNLNPVILLWVLEGLIEPSLQWNTKGLLNGF